MTDLTTIAAETDAFYRDPNAVCPFSNGQRNPMATSIYGTEFLSYQAVRDGFRDKRMIARNVDYFRRVGASELVLEFIREGNLNFMAPDKHDRIRAIVLKAFTPARVNGFRPQMRRIANELIDRFIDAERCDLVADFAHVYPIAVLAEFLGISPEDVPDFADATVQLRMLGQRPIQPGLPALEGALTYLYSYIEGVVARRREDRQDDFVGSLIALQEAGEKLSETELIWAIVFLMLGGHDTTRFTLAGCFHSLIEAGLWERVGRDPALAPEAVAEGMRHSPGTPRQMRVVDEPFERDGHRFEKDDIVSLNLCAAGRDATMFEDPHAFRLDRPKPLYDLGFGFGRHVCIGQLLARAEMAEAVEIVTARLTDVAIDGDVRLKPSGVIAGYDAIPIRFARR
ncbi:cytochrome P450 [Sphingomonas crocodyli]|nr:cytochrome P450 [Sphingomonas crocodyli]